jgi:hypothetical protein
MPAGVEVYGVFMELRIWRLLMTARAGEALDRLAIHFLLSG